MGADAAAPLRFPTGSHASPIRAGISHAPGEAATDADCAAGVAALADVLEELACR